MSDEKRYFPWDEGRPTKPDVDAIMKAYPPETIKPGAWQVTDEEIKTLIGTSSEGIRYRTVYSKWIKRLQRDHNIIVYRQKVTGFYCPTPEQVFANTHPAIESAGLKLGHQLRAVSIVKPENELQVATQQHQGRLLYQLKKETKKTRMNLLVETKANVTPRINLPKANKPTG